MASRFGDRHVLIAGLLFGAAIFVIYGLRDERHDLLAGESP